MGTDNARAEADAEAIRLAPVDDVFPSRDAQAHYRCGFRDGAKWAAGRAETTTATTEAEAGARAVSEMGDWFMRQGFDRDVIAAQACYERAARLRGGGDQ